MTASVTARVPLLALGLAVIAAGGLRPVAAAQETVRVAGTVAEAGAAGRPVEGAAVRLADLSGSVRETVTDLRGGFVFAGVTPGEYVLGVRRIGYEDLSFPLEVGSGAPVPVDVRLALRAIPLEPLNVDIEGRPLRLAETGFYDRLEEGWGSFFEPAWVETRRAGFIGLAHFVSNLQLRAPLSRCRSVHVYYDRRWIGLASGWGTSGPVSINAAGTHQSPAGPVPRLLDELSATDIGAAELYRSSTPMPLFALNDTTIACGAIILWSDWMARTREIPQIEVELCEPAGRRGEIVLDGFVEDELTSVRLPAAHVFASVRASGGTGRRDLGVRTDSLGRYRLCDLPAGAEVELKAAYESYAGVSVVVGPAAGSDVKLAVPVTVPGSVAGLVVNEGTGRPFRGVPVELTGTDFRAVTTSAGRFSLEGLPPGPYRIRAVCAGFESMAREVEVAQGGQVRVLLALRPEGWPVPRRCAGPSVN